MSKFVPVSSVQNIRHDWHLMRNRKTMWQMLREALRGHYRMSILTTLAICIAIAYIVFPFDIIPDYIPVLGWIDDGLVFYLLLKRLSSETKRYIRHKAIERKYTRKEVF